MERVATATTGTFCAFTRSARSTSQMPLRTPVQLAARPPIGRALGVILCVPTMLGTGLGSTEQNSGYGAAAERRRRLDRRHSVLQRRWRQPRTAARRTWRRSFGAPPCRLRRSLREAAVGGTAGYANRSRGRSAEFHFGPRCLGRGRCFSRRNGALGRLHGRHWACRIEASSLPPRASGVTCLTSSRAPANRTVPPTMPAAQPDSRPAARAARPHGCSPSSTVESR